MFQTKVLDKIRTHSMLIFFFENRFVYEIMWKNMVERGRPRITIWCMRIACWIPKATNTHSEYVILTAFPLHLVSRKRLTYVTGTMPVLLVMAKYYAPCALQVWRTAEFMYKDRRKLRELEWVTHSSFWVPATLTSRINSPRECLRGVTAVWHSTKYYVCQPVR